jgi:hypothetical protein
MRKFTHPVAEIFAFDAGKVIESAQKQSGTYVADRKVSSGEAA